MSSRLNTMRPRKSRVWGQNRRKMARSGTGGRARRGCRPRRPVVVLACGSRRRCRRWSRSSLLQLLTCEKPRRPTGTGGASREPQLLSGTPPPPWPPCVAPRLLRARTSSACGRGALVRRGLSCLSALLLAGLAVASSLCGACGSATSAILCCRSGDARFGVARHVFRSRRWFVSRFLRLHSGRAVDHSLGAVKNPERDHLPGRTGQDAGSVGCFDRRIHPFTTAL